MRSNISTKGAKAKADRLFSLIIRSRGRCENCGSTDTLQCAHIISRSYANTRCDEQNAFCLCATCHIRFTHWPLEWAEFVIGRIGDLLYGELCQRAQSRAKVDWEKVAADLKARWEVIEAAA